MYIDIEGSVLVISSGCSGEICHCYIHCYCGVKVWVYMDYGLPDYDWKKIMGYHIGNEILDSIENVFFVNLIASCNYS